MTIDTGAALSWAWNKFTQNAGPLIIVMVIAFVGTLVALLVSIVIRSAVSSSLVGFLVSTAITDVLLFVVSGFLHIGVYQSALAIAKGQPVDPGKMFTTDMLGPYLIAMLLYGLMVAVGSLLCLVPGLIIAFLGFLTPFYVLDQRLAPTDAIRASFQVTSKNVSALLVFAIVDFVVYVVGAIACGVGLLVTAPVALLAATYVYRQVNGQPVAA